MTAGPDRTLLINLTNPDGATIATGNGTGTVQNDHVRVTAVSPSQGTVGTATLALTVDGAGFTGSTTPTVSLVTQRRRRSPRPA